MKLMRSSRDKLVFHLGKREKRLFLETLDLYPRIPPAHYSLSQGGQVPDQETSQRLLEEALAEQRSENKKQLQAFLADPQRFQETDTGAVLSLSWPDTEWLLQIFNDIRVGSWIALGSPERKISVLNEKTVRDYCAMELAGDFESHLLLAMRGNS